MNRILDARYQESDSSNIAQDRKYLIIDKQSMLYNVWTKYDILF